MNTQSIIQPYLQPEIRTHDIGVSTDGNLKGSVEVFYFGATIDLLLWIYANTNITVYLPGSSVVRIEKISGDPREPECKSRILHGFRMAEVLPIESDVKQTVWAYNKKDGRIRVTPLNGFLGGYIDVSLIETIDFFERPGVKASWSLDRLFIRNCREFQWIVLNTFQTVRGLPLLGILINLPTIIFETMRDMTVTAISSIIIYYATKIPPVLAQLEYDARNL